MFLNYYTVLKTSTIIYKNIIHIKQIILLTFLIRF